MQLQHVRALHALHELGSRPGTRRHGPAYQPAGMLRRLHLQTAPEAGYRNARDDGRTRRRGRHHHPMNKPSSRWNAALTWADGTVHPSAGHRNHRGGTPRGAPRDHQHRTPARAPAPARRDKRGVDQTGRRSRRDHALRGRRPRRRDRGSRTRRQTPRRKRARGSRRDRAVGGDAGLDGRHRVPVLRTRSGGTRSSPTKCAHTATTRGTTSCAGCGCR